MTVDSGFDSDGTRWALTVTGDGLGLLVSVGFEDALLYGADRDRFAEAAARAVTPGQEPSAPPTYYACCIHCEHNGETDPDLDDERHPNPCGEGCRPVASGQGER
jgi:hypothetical protein